MRPAELDVRRDVTLVPRGGLTRGTADHYFLPASADEVAVALARARQLLPDTARGAITPSGAERSFEAHFLPRAASTLHDASHGATPRVVVSSRRLRGEVRVLGPTTTARGVPALAVKALAGTSFAELLRAVKNAGHDAMPFSCPTADAISLGGALAVNTHGCTSATYGGLFAEHVRRFTLLAADGRAYDCHAGAANELERRLFRYVPGALGALGVVTDVELELAGIAPDASVVTEVLDSRRAEPAESVAIYLARAAENARTRPFPEGVWLGFFGAPGRGTGVVVGRRLATPNEPPHPILPLHGKDADFNVLLQAFSHRFPELARRIAASLFPSGKIFRAPYYRWAFFQSSYDDGAARLARRAPHSSLFGFATALELVHQAWVLTSAALPVFMALATELFRTPEFEPVADALEFFDVLPLPAAHAPLDASRAITRGEPSAESTPHGLTLSVAVRNPRTRALAIAFCHTLTERALTRELAVVVQLNKQHHVEPATLRAMHHVALGELRALKAEVDPEGLIGSRSLERLGLSP